MPEKQAISIVVPTLNEADNIPTLLERIDQAMQQVAVPYEVLIIDDHSTDGTMQLATSLAAKYPVRAILKNGKRGKAYSLLEGFAATSYSLVAMIDADLQYPPEALAPMYALLTENNLDVVTTERQAEETSKVRKLFTKVYNLIFARLLFGISFDTQSGLKLFRKRILNKFEMTPSPWSFDLEFLVRALENKFKIASYPITFSERTAGVTKVKLLSTTLELATASLKLRLRISIRKLRAGYRANTLFLQKAFPVGMLSLVALASVFLMHPATSHALSLPEPVEQVLSVPGDVLPSVLQSDPTTTPDQLPIATNSLANTSTTQPSSSSTTTSQQTETQSMQTASSTTAPSLQTQMAYNINQSTTPQIQLATYSNAKNGAATAAKKTGIYSSTYPAYRLNSNLTQRFTTLSGAALIVSGLSFMVGGLLCLYRRKVAYAYQQISHR